MKRDRPTRAESVSASVNPARRHLSRRTVLLSVAGVIVGSTELAVSIPDSSAGGRAAKATLAASTDPATHDLAPFLLPPVPTKVSTTPRVPLWARRWNTPIYELDDFLRRAPGVHLPRRSIMLTVDDGPHPEWTPKYLRLFEKHDVKATFCVIGEQIASNRKIVRSVAAEGHTLANHTWTHDEGLRDRSRAQIHAEIARTNDAINRLTGIHPTIFRAPAGVWGPAIFDELAREQMMPLGWDIDPRDWARPGVAAIESNMLQAGPGDIILCHDGGGDRSETFEALKTVIPALKRRGFHFAQLP